MAETVQLFNPDLDRNPAHFLYRPSPYVSARTALKRMINALPPSRPGFDTNHWRTWSDPAASREDAEHVFIKATEGIAGVDSKFTEHWQKALDAGFLVGVYHFFRDIYDGVQQAEHFLEIIQPFITASKGVYALGWDVETNDGATITNRRTRCKAGLTYLRDNLRKAHKYSSKYLWETLIGDTDWGNDPTLSRNWIASWTSADLPSLPKQWTLANTDFWQNGIYPTHAWTTDVSGHSNPEDRDLALVADYTALEALFGKVPVVASNYVRFLQSRKLYAEPSTVAVVKGTADTGTKMNWHEELYKPVSGATFLRVSYSTSPDPALWILEKDSQGVYAERFTE